MTNAPREGLGASAGWEQRRVRWQVELASRVFKGEGGIERAQARNRWRVPREPYARRLAMAVPRWVLLAAGHRQRRHSGQPAARRVRKRSAGLRRALGGRREMSRQVKELARQLEACQMQKRHKRPSTLERLTELDAEWRSLDQAP